MIRGLPYSILVHVLVLALAIFYGNAVQRQVIKPPRSIKVRMVQLPTQARPVQQEEAPPQPVESTPPPVQEKAPELPPKALPEKKEQPKPKPVEKKPEPPREEPPVQEQPDPAPADLPDDDPATAETPLVSGPAVAGTDVDFPFAWYLARVQGQVARNWKPKQLGFRSRSVVSCLVHFTINKNGTVSQVTLTRPSGVGVFDREALRVVQGLRALPLPSGFSASSLGISMEFNLESGI